MSKEPKTPPKPAFRSITRGDYTQKNYQPTSSVQGNSKPTSHSAPKDPPPAPKKK